METTTVHTIASIAAQARSFETDFDAQVAATRMAAANVEQVRALFASIQRNCQYAESAASISDGYDRIRHLIRVAFLLGRLATIFKGARREGWVDRSIALCRVVENVVTGDHRPI